MVIDPAGYRFFIFISSLPINFEYTYYTTTGINVNAEAKLSISYKL